MQAPIKTIGWIGTGIMGLSMCKHLIKNGYNLKVQKALYLRCTPEPNPRLRSYWIKVWSGLNLNS